MIPCASIKLQHKRIDDCEAMMKLGFIFSSPQRPVTPKLASLFCHVYWASHKSRDKMLTKSSFTAMKYCFNSRTCIHLVEII